MDCEKYIVDSITSMAGEHTPYQIFTDWVHIQAISIQNACKMIIDRIYVNRELEFKTITEKYSINEFQILSNMHGALAEILSEDMRDVLGDIYMKAECANKGTGQFFTPYYISYMTAKATYEDTIKYMRNENQIKIMEPSSGSGGMIIAIAQLMKENKINYQKKLFTIAQDLDWNGVYMTYVQLSLLGIKALVVQGDSLSEPYNNYYNETRVFRTPAQMGALI